MCKSFKTNHKFKCINKIKYHKGFDFVTFNKNELYEAFSIYNSITIEIEYYILHPNNDKPLAIAPKFLELYFKEELK